MCLAPCQLLASQSTRVEDRMRFMFIYPAPLGNDIHIPLPAARGSASVFADDYSIQLAVGRGNAGFFRPQKNSSLGRLSAFPATYQKTNGKTRIQRDQNATPCHLPTSHLSPLRKVAPVDSKSAH